MHDRNHHHLLKLTAAATVAVAAALAAAARLVANLRSKTLDVIESHAAWQRKIANPAEPFSYKGKPYLLTMGQGLRFLDEAPWLAGRLLHCAAVQDVLLAGVTPDGVALDAVAGFDVRHGEFLEIHSPAQVEPLWCEALLCSVMLTPDGVALDAVAGFDVRHG
jgi:hypothetical protein